MYDKMQSFSRSTGFITFFLVACLLLGMFGGEKLLFWFLLLVLFGMLLTNAEAFAYITNKFSTPTTGTGFGGFGSSNSGGGRA